MMVMLDSIVGIIVLMLILIVLLLVFIACKPWRFISRIRSGYHKDGELDRPLVSDDLNLVIDQDSELTREYDLEGACYQNEGLLRLPRTEGLVHKQRLLSASHLVQGDSVILNIISEPSENIVVGQTLKRPLVKDYLHQVQKQDQQADQSGSLKVGSESDTLRPPSLKSITDQRSCLSLEVISGPSRGLHCFVHSTSSSELPLTLGRVSPSVFILKDSEVSGKHAKINWNPNNLKWELVDMGSLNGTLLNSQPVNHHDSGKRQCSDPIQLADGDIVTLGTTSNIHVHITSQNENQIPFGVGVASDPMWVRRGGKRLPMEDVSYHQWPLPGVDQFGLFGICDGHGGKVAAESAIRILPQMVATILSDPLKRERVLLQCDASDVLRAAFYQTEACMDHYYEGCTSTLLLVWTDGNGKFFAQCANVGDTACFMNIDGNQIAMTEDHRISSTSERLRIQETGEPLRDGETRLCGLNLARMLGDKFAKEADPRFSSEPYVSQAVRIDQAVGPFAVIASDGFWDVVTIKKACQLVIQSKENYANSEENLAWRVANSLLGEARAQRTKDNTSIIFLDFDSISRNPSCKVDS